MVLQYYALLRSVLKTCPSRRRCLTRCRHCRIFFLCDPRNAGRGDLGCPFGCAQAHRQRGSNQRSTAYYRDSNEGRLKKKIQNVKRRGHGTGTSPTPSPSAPQPAPAHPWPEPIVNYVWLVVCWIEGRPVSIHEIRDMLVRVLRQHRMARRRRIDQVVAWLNERPP